MTPKRALRPLLPVRQRDPLRLNDADAIVEDEPEKGKLKELLQDSAERIAERQDVLYADGRFAFAKSAGGRSGSRVSDVSTRGVLPYASETMRCVSTARTYGLVTMMLARGTSWTSAAAATRICFCPFFVSGRR